ncbi:MAG: hypothetical protein SXA11_02245 [Cyanobacteriota bacterium]|nr:hypothetical protein [Cyanobacteriota bacterium]
MFSSNPQDSLPTAHQQMQNWRTSRLVVWVAEGELQGIVMESNLLRSLNPVEMYRVVRALGKSASSKRKK